MANFSGGDAGFEKGYLEKVAMDIEEGKEIKFAGNVKQVVNMTDEVVSWIAAVKKRDINKVNNAFKTGAKFLPIFNGYTWTKIDKAPYSGQGGSGAGDEITALGECFHAYISAARQKKGSSLNSWLEGVDLLDSSTISRFTDCDRTLKQCLDGLDEAWKNSAVIISNKLSSQLGTGNYKFLRGGTVVTNIENNYKKLKRVAGITLNVNKWNPSDMWAMKIGFSLDTNQDTLDDFNQLLLQEYKNKNLIGVSLKKLASNAKTCYEEEFNGGNPRPEAKFVKYSISGIGKNVDWSTSYPRAGSASKDVYVYYKLGAKEYNMQIRTFSSVMSGWQGEIKGTTAAGGKIGGGNLQTALQFAGIADREYHSQSEFKIKSRITNNTTIAEFTKMYNYLGDVNMTEEDMALFLADYSNEWLYSKFLGLQFIYTMLTKRKSDEVMSQVISIASSSTPKSSVFLKYS